MAISDHNYNQARAILVLAGSATAGAAHVKHTQGNGSPDNHGKSLLSEARDEFQTLDRGQAGLQAGMIQAHYQAIHDAADQMGITEW